MAKFGIGRKIRSAFLGLIGVIKRHKVIFLIILTVGLLVIISVAFYVNNKNSKKNKQTTTYSVCSQDLLKQAGEYLDPVDYQKLKPIVDKIKALPNYDKDPNCLNIIVTYYVNASDPDNASRYLLKLEAIYDSKVGFAIKGSGFRTLSSLKMEVQALQQQQKQLIENSQKFFSGSKKK